jgi:hypothetical protein
MAAVLISCPTTGGLVPVGVQAAELDELEPENLMVDCPECGSEHRWEPIDAVLTSHGERAVAT